MGKGIKMPECAMCDTEINHTAIPHYLDRVFHWGCFEKFVEWLLESENQKGIFNVNIH